MDSGASFFEAGATLVYSGKVLFEKLLGLAQ